MKKDELITKQQLELESLRVYKRVTNKKLTEIRNSFYSIGAPLNDNVLKFNNAQLEYLMNLSQRLEKLID